MKITQKKLTLLAMIIAINVVVARFVLIPMPTGGNINLCDAGIILAALAFGRKRGGIVGALSGLLLDLVSGYVIFAPFSFVVHGVEGYLVGYLYEKRKNILLAVIVGILILVGGYFLVDMILFKVQTGIIGLPSNTIQGLVGSLVGVFLYNALKKKLKEFD